MNPALKSNVVNKKVIWNKMDVTINGPSFNYALWGKNLAL